jgi:hypothetical protein
MELCKLCEAIVRGELAEAKCWQCPAAGYRTLGSKPKGIIPARNHQLPNMQSRCWAFSLGFDRHVEEATHDVDLRRRMSAQW